MSRPRRIPQRGDVAASAVAELLGLSIADFEARREELRRRDFPEPRLHHRPLLRRSCGQVALAAPFTPIPELTRRLQRRTLTRCSANGCGGSMGRIKIPYYADCRSRLLATNHACDRRISNGPVRCRGPEAWALAEWNKRWQAVRKGQAPPLVNLDQLPAIRRKRRDVSVRVNRRCFPSLHSDS